MCSFKSEHMQCGVFKKKILLHRQLNKMNLACAEVKFMISTDENKH